MSLARVRLRLHVSFGLLGMARDAGGVDHVLDTVAPEEGREEGVAHAVVGVAVEDVIASGGEKEVIASAALEGVIAVASI